MLNNKNLFKSLNYFLAIIFVLLNFTGAVVFANDDLTINLKEHIIPIETFEVNKDFSDLKALGKMINNKKIIGIGESTPGAREFYSLKTRIIEYLVMEMNFRGLAIDGSYSDIQIANDYINGIGELEDAIWELKPFPWAPEKLENNEGYSIASHTYLAPYSTVEFEKILIWMKEYNKEASDQDKIKIYGIGFENPERDVDNLLHYISKVDNETGEIYSKKLSDLKLVHGLDFKYPELRSIGLFTGMLDELKKIVESKEKVYLENSSIDEYEIAIKNFTTIFQWVQYRSLNLNKGMESALDLKAEYLYENIKWIIDKEYKDKNEALIIWSNNIDIAKDTKDHKSMGQYLQEEYDDEYYAIGLDFFKGRFRAYGIDIWGSPISNYIAKFDIEKTENDHLVYNLEKTKISLGFLDFKSSIKDKNIKELLDKDQKIHNATFMYPGKYTPKSLLPHITQQYISQRPINSYDGFLFVNNISETHGLYDSRDTKIENGDKEIIEYYRDIIAGQIGTILVLLLVLVLIIIWLVKKWKKKKTRPGARYPGSRRWD